MATINHLMSGSSGRTASVWSALRQWQLGLVVILSIATVSSALSVVFIQHIYRQHLRHLHQTMLVHDQLDREWAQLLVEHSAWGALDHIEREAHAQLAMVIPTLQKTRFLSSEIPHFADNESSESDVSSALAAVAFSVAPVVAPAKTLNHSES